MADGFTIEIKGLAELQAKLEDLGTKAADRAWRKALRAGAEIEQAAIIERAPVKGELDDGHGGVLPPGAIKADIVIKMKRDDQGNPIAVVGPDEYTRRIAGFVEYGHRLVRGGYNKELANGKTRGPGKVVGQVDEHPFIRKAYEATREEVATAIAETLAAEIEKEASK
jgi:HK97 gp10 family phage protein